MIFGEGRALDRMSVFEAGGPPYLCR
jgi:hypothetical protein